MELGAHQVTVTFLPTCQVVSFEGLAISGRNCTVWVTIWNCGLVVSPTKRHGYVSDCHGLSRGRSITFDNISSGRHLRNSEGHNSGSWVDIARELSYSSRSTSSSKQFESSDGVCAFGYLGRIPFIDVRRAIVKGYRKLTSSLRLVYRFPILFARQEK